MTSNTLSQSLALSALALTGLFAGGCTKTNGNLRNVLPPCTVQSDCSTGEICTDEGCAPVGCRGDYDCQTGWRCYRATNTSYCAPDDGTPPTPIPGGGGGGTVDMGGGGSPDGGGGGGGGGGGLTCNSESPCPDGQSCVGGRCYSVAQASCGVLEWSQCSASTPCGSGKQCVGGQCLSTCTQSCGTGSVCTNGLCVPHAGTQCTWSSDCGGRASCINGTCFSLCNSDAQCLSTDRCVRGTCRSK